jgi:MoaA/NifB/PqqE/SkfB family radical SAM enzyme
MEMVRELADMKVERISLTGRGEPTTHDHILPIIHSIEQHGMQCQLVTNGVIFKEEFAKELVKVGCHHVSTSVNAASEETFRTMCGRNNLENGYETAVSFIRDLVESKRAMGRSLPTVEVTHVIYANNYRDLPDMVEQWCNQDIDYLGFNMIGTVDDTEFLKLDEHARSWILQVSGDWIEKLTAAGVRNNMPDFLRVVQSEERSITTEDNLQRQLPCFAGWMESAIGPDGAVRGCCYCDDVLGNVHTDGGFKAVWTNPTYERMRRDSLKMHLTGTAICEDCFTTCNRGPDNQRIQGRRKRLRLKTPG